MWKSLTVVIQIAATNSVEPRIQNPKCRELKVKVPYFMSITVSPVILRIFIANKRTAPSRNAFILVCQFISFVRRFRRAKR